ncbi:anchor protein [Opitutaceae bacterium TAV5]|nr:anchor protein [Opitutaceae bacterium TAV5]
MQTHSILLLLTGLLTCATSVWATPVEIDLLGRSWYRSSTNITTWSKTSTQIVYRPNTENTEALAYFANQSSPVTLDIGEKLTLSFDYTITGAVNNRASSLRMGLFNSGEATRVSGNFSSAAGADDYTGYFITTNPGATGETGTALRARTDGSSTSYLLGGGASSVPGVVLDSSASTKVTLNASYSGFLEIARISATEVRITYSFGGESVVWTDSVYNYTSFDTIGVNFSKVSSADSTTLTINRLTLEVTAIPEPATVALLGGLGSFLLAVACGRRRQR